MNPDKPRKRILPNPLSLIARVGEALKRKKTEPEETELSSYASSHRNVPSEMMPFADSLQAMVRQDTRGPVDVTFRPHREDDYWSPEEATAFAIRGGGDYLSHSGYSDPDKIVMLEESFPTGEFDPQLDTYPSARRVLAHEFGHIDDYRRLFDDREGFEERKQISDALQEHRIRKLDEGEWPEGGFTQGRDPETDEFTFKVRYQDDPQQLYADAFAEGVRYLQRTHALDPESNIEQVPPHLKLMVDNLLERDIYQNHPLNKLRREHTTTIRPTEEGNILERARDAIADDPRLRGLASMHPSVGSLRMANRLAKALTRKRRGKTN